MDFQAYLASSSEEEEQQQEGTVNIMYKRVDSS